jgi:hypothetical protein
LRDDQATLTAARGRIAEAAWKLEEAIDRIVAAPSP